MERLRLAATLGDEALAAELARLARSERSATAALIAHLAEFDERRLHLAAGFSSLFRYCTESLRLSEHEAYNRIEAARLARRFPQVVDRIEDGSLNLTTVRLLAPHLNEENQEALLAGSSHRSKSEVEELLARHFPRPDVASTIRRLPTPQRPSAHILAGLVTASADGVEGSARSQEPVAAQETSPHTHESSPTIRPAVMRPLAADRYEIRFTATATTCDKLRMAKDLLRHAVPNGDVAEIVDRALTVLLQDLVRKKFAVTRQPRSTDKPARAEPKAAGPATPPAAEGCSTRHIPAAVKRAVWLRDGGCCALMAKGGRRCGTRAFLEFHHRHQPFAVGGAATADNIQLRCRAHNAYEADLFYGQRPPAVVELVPERVALHSRPEGGEMTI